MEIMFLPITKFPSNSFILLKLLKPSSVSEFRWSEEVLLTGEITQLAKTDFPLHSHIFGRFLSEQ